MLITLSAPFNPTRSKSGGEEMESVVGGSKNPAALGAASGAGFGVSPAQTVVVGHFDVHGVCASALAAKAFSATEVYASYPATSPESVVQTLQNLYAAAPQRLRIVLVDIPVDLKNPVAFVRGLEDLALRHEIIFIDHHESTLPYLTWFQRVKAIFVGTSALQMNMALYNMIPEKTDLDRLVAVLGAVGDRDGEVVRQSLLTAELQNLADGMDVIVRERDGALRAVRALVQNPIALLDEAKTKAGQIPSASLGQRIGPVVVAATALPAQWGPKSLERLAFQTGAWYAAGWSYDERSRQWVVRAIIRWDVQARMPRLPLPGAVARQIWSTRSIIGHPAAPSVAATSETEAQEMALAWARALADAATKSATPAVATLISESRVGEMLAEILQRLEQILEAQKAMYSEYLELKRRQVQLLERQPARAGD
jgi:hypothetical protein